MLTIVHGTDTALSRKYFIDEKNNHPEAILLNEDQVTYTDLLQLFDGGDLFGEIKYLFIEQLLTKRKKSKDYDDILSILQKYADEHTILLWEGKELERSTLNALKNTTVKNFKLPQTVFQFLDALKPGNGRHLIKLFQETVKATETEMIFFMLVRQIRILLSLSDAHYKKNQSISDQDQIDEIKRMAPWQKTKLLKQANLFQIDHLLDLYNKLFQLEIGQKTGTLTLPLTSAIDFFLLEV